MTTTTNPTASSRMSQISMSTSDQALYQATLGDNIQLEKAMTYLDKADASKKVSFYFQESERIMNTLHRQYEGEEQYLPWVRYLDISARKKEEYPGIKEGTQGPLFKQEMEKLIQNVLLKNQGINTFDWRIAKKMLSVPLIFPKDSSFLSSISKEDIRRAVKNEIEKALETLIWSSQERCLIKLAKSTLEVLKECVNDESKEMVELLSQAIISGRFDKGKFGLENSVICGEDGGCFLLLNRLTQDQQEDMINENIVTKEFLKDKLIMPKNQEPEKVEDDKIVIGQGGFGAVKFALSLFQGKASPGDVICIKKSKNFEYLAAKGGGMLFSALQQATEATVGDYFSSDIAEKVFAPEVFDLALVTTESAISTNKKGRRNDHRKGYLMMQMFPQNTATRIFSETKYQEWKYQKPYLQEILQCTQDLLSQKIAFTDLKPDNSLYDADIFKTMIIDLGGCIKINDGQSAEQFSKGAHSYQTTEAFRAPELADVTTDIIDMRKALAYTCGKVIAGVTQKTDYPKKDEIQSLIAKLTDLKPDQRINIDEAIQILNGIGDDDYKKEIVSTQYIAKIKDRIEHNLSSISLNEDIKQTRDEFINLRTTNNDPSKYKNLPVDKADLFEQINKFLTPKNEQQVMAIFGSAGSGKSIALQNKFLEAVQKWKSGEPLPIYFNLANGIDLQSILNSINTELGTNLKTSELKLAHLYIDSFDEGIGIEDKQQTLIKGYLKEFVGGGKDIKIIVTCRTDYLRDQSNYSWFTPIEGESKKLITTYIVPFNYEKEANLVHVLLVATYLKGSKKYELTGKESLHLINSFRLKEFIETGFMFKMIMEVLPELQKEENQNGGRKLSKQDIYLRYISHYQRRHLDKLNEEQKQQVYENIKFLLGQEQKIMDKGLQTKSLNTKESNDALQELGKYIAVQLHLLGSYRLDQECLLLQAMGYENSIPFKKQSLAYILKILPMKIEVKTNKQERDGNEKSKITTFPKNLKQDVKLGFLHDTIKNCFLLESIKDELRNSNNTSKILSTKRVVEDAELIRFIADAVKHDESLKNSLRLVINVTKTDKSESASIGAANAITILVAAGYSFHGQDLSNVNIKGANLRNGWFREVDFTNSDLSYSNLTNIEASSATAIKTDLRGVNLGILPELSGPSGHKNAVYCVYFSANRKYIASGSADKTVKIWNVSTGDCLATLTGHIKSVRSVSFSGDEKYVVSGSDDKSVMIWDVATSNCLATLTGHTSGVTSVSFSVDGKYVASGSSDKTVKIWDVATNNCIATLTGHIGWVNSVSFSGDGKYVSSGSGHKYSENNSVKIWDVISTNCIATLSGHIQEVTSVSFSRDGKYVASCSQDNSAKIWDVTTSTCLTTLKGHTDTVYSVSFSGDGKYIASGSSDNSVKIWDVTTGNCLATLPGHTQQVWSVSFSSDGKYVASGSNDYSVKIWDVTTSNCLTILTSHTANVTSVSFSRDGKYVASGSWDNSVKILDVTTNNCLTTLKGHHDWVNSVSFSGDGKYITSGSRDSSVKIWDVTTSNCLATLPGHTDEVNSVSFSSDGKYIASGSADRSVKIWDVTTSNCLATFTGHTSSISSVSFCGNEKYVASCSLDESVKIWEVTTSKCLATLTGHTKTVSSVSFSGDGKYVASSSYDDTVKIWDVTTSTCLATLAGHTGHVTSVSFSDDGKYVASGSWDNSVKIWDVITSNCLATLTGHTSSVSSVCFSGDGKYIASGSYDKSVKIWTISNEKWVILFDFGGVEHSLSTSKMIIKEALLSTQNQKALGQHGVKLDSIKIVDEPFAKIQNNLKTLIELASTLSTKVLKFQIEANKLLVQQRKVHAGKMDPKNFIKKDITNQQPAKDRQQNINLETEVTIVKTSSCCLVF